MGVPPPGSVLKSCERMSALLLRLTLSLTLPGKHCWAVPEPAGYI